MKTILDIVTIISFMMMCAFNEDNLMIEAIWYCSWFAVCVGSAMLRKKLYAEEEEA